MSSELLFIIAIALGLLFLVGVCVYRALWGSGLDR